MNLEMALQSEVTLEILGYQVTYTLEQLLDRARSLGAVVEFSSANPGIYTMIQGEKVKATPADLFPECHDWMPKEKKADDEVASS